jgi:hypothetical protein
VWGATDTQNFLSQKAKFILPLKPGYLARIFYAGLQYI